MEQQQNGGNPALGKVQCKKCNSAFTIDMPPTIISNHPLYSVAVIPHETPATCPACGQLHAFYCVQVQAALDVQMIEDNRNKLIVPAGNLRLT